MTTLTRVRIGTSILLLILSNACANDLARSIDRAPEHPAPSLAVGQLSSPALSSSLDPAATFEILHHGLHAAYGINDAGLVVGDSWSPTFAATWTLAGGVSVIGALPGGGQSRFDDVNTAGKAVGMNNFSGSTKALLWDQATNTLTDLGIPAGGPAAHAIADNGDVVGTDYTGYARGFFKPNGGTTVFLTAIAPFVSVHATDMNNSGQLIGTGLVTDFISHAITWTRSDQPLTALDHLGGDHSTAENINDAGDIVGWSELAPGSAARHALLWPTTGGVVDLSTWPNGCAGSSEAFGINAAGIIVGQCDGLPVLWTAAQGMRSLPVPNWGSPFAAVHRINNRLEMIGGEAYWRLLNRPPVAAFTGPSSAHIYATVSVDGTNSSDPDGDTLTYDWNFDDGSPHGTGATATHAYLRTGDFTITLTVTDPYSATGVSVADVSITSSASTALASTLDPLTTFEIHHHGLHIAYGINDAGLVVGDSWTPQLAATWTLAGGVTVIGSLPGGGQSRFDDVNSSGQAVGINLLWDQATNTLVDLGIPAGAPNAHAIADNGDVVGTDYTGYARGFFKPNGGSTVFLTATDPFVSVHATDMNNAGQLIGTGLVTDLVSHAVTWLRSAEQLVALQHRNGDHSNAEGINDAGDIVGWTELRSGDPTRHAVLWPATGGMIDLAAEWPLRCAGSSEAFGINAAGIIVGECNGLPALWTAVEGMRILPEPTWGSGFATVHRINNRLEMIGGEAFWRLTNRTPVAVASAGSAVEGGAVAFSSAGSTDPDGDPLTFSWDFGDGATGTGPAPSHAYADNGSYNASLTVTDGGGLSNTAAVSVSVTNLAPVVNAGPDAAVTTDQSFTLAGSFADAGLLDTPWGYTIDWGDGSASVIGSLASQSVGISGSHQYLAGGSYTVEVTVTDKDGGVGAATAVVTVTAVNHPPVALIGGPATGKEGTPVSYNGTGSSDPDGDPLSYSWNFGDGATGSGVTVSHTYADNGSYPVTLTVTDGRGGSGTAGKTMTIKNEAPVPTLRYVSSVISTGSKCVATLTLEAGFTDKGVLDAPWQSWVNWGDGFVSSLLFSLTTGGKLQITHSFNTTKATNFKIYLNVEDKDHTQGLTTYQFSCK